MRTELESSLIQLLLVRMQLQSSLIQLESSLIQLLPVRIALKSSLIVIITSKNRIVELSNTIVTSKY